MIVYHQNNVAAFAGGQTYYWFFQPLFSGRVSQGEGAPSGRIMGALAGDGGLAGPGGLVGPSGGLAS